MTLPLCPTIFPNPGPIHDPGPIQYELPPASSFVFWLGSSLTAESLWIP